MEGEKEEEEEKERIGKATATIMKRATDTNNTTHIRFFKVSQSAKRERERGNGIDRVEFWQQQQKLSWSLSTVTNVQLEGTRRDTGPDLISSLVQAFAVS